MNQSMEFQVSIENDTLKGNGREREREKSAYKRC